MPSAVTRGSTVDVLGIGNAIVDVVAQADDALIHELGLEKGAMTLIDEARSEELYARMGPGREISGGSVGNTIAAIAAMGGTPAYIGRVKDDQLGRIFAHDIRAAGVAFGAAAGGRRAGHRPLPGLRHAGRAAHHADLSRRLRRSRA